MFFEIFCTLKNFLLLGKDQTEVFGELEGYKKTLNA